jgi:hypothetical protein
MRILRRGLKGNLRLCLEQISLDLEEEKDVIGMLKIISNQTLEVDKEL